jgi:hypothetical protein
VKFLVSGNFQYRNFAIFSYQAERSVTVRTSRWPALQDNPHFSLTGTNTGRVVICIPTETRVASREAAGEIRMLNGFLETVLFGKSRKGKFAAGHVAKKREGRGGAASLILNLVTRWRWTVSLLDPVMSNVVLGSADHITRTEEGRNAHNILIGNRENVYVYNTTENGIDGTKVSVHCIDI